MNPNDVVLSWRPGKPEVLYVSNHPQVDGLHGELILDAFARAMNSPVVEFSSIPEHERPFKGIEIPRMVKLDAAEFPLMKRVHLMGWFCIVQADLMPSETECEKLPRIGPDDPPRDPLRPFPCRASKWSGNRVAWALHEGAGRLSSEAYFAVLCQVCDRASAFLKGDVR